VEECFLDFGNKLKLHMKRHCWSQSDLANKTGLSQPFISTICRNEKLPSLENVVRICEIMGITPNDLLLHSSDSRPAEKFFVVSEEERLLISKIRILSERDHKVVRCLIDSMLSFGK